MARYRGPQTKKSRSMGESLFGYDKSFEKRNYPPGQHGPSKRRKTKSEYALQLREKQKAKYTYGILERQFRNIFKEASRRTGNTGETLMQLLESRLDNVVYRLGIAPTRRAARQLVGHKHVMVNGSVVNIPSYSLRPGDTISLRERSKGIEMIESSLVSRNDKFNWLVWDGKEMVGKFAAMPEREAIPETIKETLIVELYSK
jgi:small subunit ribosomal protein S4